VGFLTYLGSKRKLLDEIAEEVAAVTPPGGTVLDLFSGSGVVSHRLKSLGYVVSANDTAPYSLPVNRANLEFDPETLAARYRGHEGYLAFLNGLESPPPGREYFSRYYSENPDAKYPRLYYTRRNGLFIDAVLDELWKDPDADRRDLVLSDLLYKMSKHVNTSGHFKTFHKEFGGVRNKHDVARVTAPIVLEWPEPPPGPRGVATRSDATLCLERAGRTWECVYLDPPYGQHQYSANYHLLEYACLPLERRYVPRNSQVSGIDPKLYKSPYCLKNKCLPALRRLIGVAATRARAVVVSLNTRGFVSLDQMRDILEGVGDTNVRPLTESEYLLRAVVRR
jgi:adenine-specific DNA-methyltransferase